VKKISYKLHKKRFHRKYPGVHVPASSTIFKLVKEAHIISHIISCGGRLGHEESNTRQNRFALESLYPAGGS
jgi:hypothetical protein